MTDDTLSQGYGFERVIVKTRLAPEDRFALAKIAQDGESGMATVRRVVQDGLRANGWPVDKRIEEYAHYAVQCIRAGKPNEFESR